MNLSLLLAALISVESGGNTLAFNPNDGAIGCLQIRQCCLDEVNHYCATDYALEDLYGNERLSRWVCAQYLSKYQAESYEEAARLWNGGPDWRSKRRRTDSYWRKVKRQLGELRDENNRVGRWGVGQRLSLSAVW